jgi:hypothetical protein
VNDDHLQQGSTLLFTTAWRFDTIFCHGLSYSTCFVDKNKISEFFRIGDIEIQDEISIRSKHPRKINH